jgi:hypothetical protein
LTAASIKQEKGSKILNLELFLVAKACPGLDPGSSSFGGKR